MKLLMAATPHVIIDDFLPHAIMTGLLNRTLLLEDFAPGRVIADGRSAYRPESRKGMLSDDRLGPYLPPFIAALKAAFVDICQKLGVPLFDCETIEIRLAAHTDGDFFSPHRDSLTGADRQYTDKDRIITAVYYFHQLPRAFSGGDLRLFPFDGTSPCSVEPRNNRLVAFPSFFMHEVTPVKVPSGLFAESRFSVSCWFDRNRQG